jgi:hypothetical protein
MKMTHKMKLVQEVVAFLKKDKIEPSQQEVSKWVMSHLNLGKYGGLKQGDFSLYFREHYVKETE